ncbi:MAG: hypothetical protein H0T46_25130 [Deltaproteobacteria bacterium]|nr:hypothetical protein [Deltaproteobacteria bacterium]
MRTAPLLLLAACSAGARAPLAPVADREAAVTLVPAPAPAAPQVTQHTYEAAEDAAAATRPIRTYALPPSTVSALARERVRGQVLVAGPLFPTQKAAAGLVSTIDDAQQPVALRVVADKGKVIQVTTTAAADCVGGFAQSYELTVFVPRSTLVPRTTAPLVKNFDDGTAYAIDRGAPVRVTTAGLSWFDTMLDQTSAAPPERLAYGLGKYVPAAVPAAPGERLVCDGAPMTKTEWSAAKQVEAERAAAKTNAVSRRIANARVQSKAAAKTDAVGALVDLALQDTMEAKADEANAPYCTVAPSTAKPVAGKLGGAAYVWTDARGNDRVYRAEQGYLADVGATCARVRVAVEPGVVRHIDGAQASSPRVARQKVWVPKAGPVFWPDGTKAGKYTGKTERFTRVTDRENFICVDVRGVAEEVCHRKGDVVVEK